MKNIENELVDEKKVKARRHLGHYLHVGLKKELLYQKEINHKNMADMSSEWQVLSGCSPI